MSDSRAFNRLVLAFRSGTLDDQVDAISLYVEAKLAERESKLDRRYMDLGELAARYREALQRIADYDVPDAHAMISIARTALGTSVPDGNYTDSIDVPPPCDTSENETKP